MFISFCTVIIQESRDGNACTVKPVLRGHLWDKEKVAL